MGENIIEGFNMKRRYGKFYYPMCSITANENETRAVLAMMGFIPTRVESLFHSGDFEMIGISPLFREIPHGTIVPTYTITLHTVDGEVVSVKAIEQDHEETLTKLVN